MTNTAKAVRTRKDHEMLERVAKKAEWKFDGVFVTGKKNVILLKRGRVNFMTIKVNFHDESFHDGNYDMDFLTAAENFKKRVEESVFSPEYDVPK